MKICITGYRPDKLPKRYGYNIDSAAYKDLSKVIKDVLLIELMHHQENALECISGMALGVDQLYVKTTDEFRKSPSMRGFSVSITAAVPCRGQETKWPVHSREVYHQILSLCDQVHFVHNGPFTPSCMEERNRWMVDRSDAVIAVWDGKSGGTANCVKYAKAKGKTIWYIHPSALTIRRETNDKKQTAKTDPV